MEESDQTEVGKLLVFIFSFYCLFSDTLLMPKFALGSFSRMINFAHLKFAQLHIHRIGIICSASVGTEIIRIEKNDAFFMPLVILHCLLVYLFNYDGTNSTNQISQFAQTYDYKLSLKFKKNTE